MYGFSAKKTLEVAQSLYERKKLISYPRTDSRFLSSEWGQHWEAWSRPLPAAIRESSLQELASFPWGKDSSTTRVSPITTPSFLP